jgi:hypothetical protein
MVYGSVYGFRGSALDGVGPQEFDESLSFAEMGSQAVVEATEDWNNMMRAIALTELSYVIETGEELIYESVDIVAIKDKVVGWFKKLWAKIQGIAKTALAKFASFAKNDEDFISKYGEDIRSGAKAIPDGFSFKGYKFETDKINKACSEVRAAYETITNEAKGKIDIIKGNPTAKTEYDKLVSKYRGDISGAGREVSANDFKKAINKYYRGTDAKIYIGRRDVDANSLITIIKGAKEAIDNTKEAESTAKETIDSSIEKIEEQANKYSDEAKDNVGDQEKWETANNRSTAFTNYADYLKNIGTATSAWFGTFIQILKDQNRQAKAICVKLVGYANGVGHPKKTNESASILEDRFASIFD